MALSNKEQLYLQHLVDCHFGDKCNVSDSSTDFDLSPSSMTNVENYFKSTYMDEQLTKSNSSTSKLPDYMNTDSEENWATGPDAVYNSDYASSSSLSSQSKSRVGKNTKKVTRYKTKPKPKPKTTTKLDLSESSSSSSIIQQQNLEYEAALIRDRAKSEALLKQKNDHDNNFSNFGCCCECTKKDQELTKLTKTINVFKEQQNIRDTQRSEVLERLFQLLPNAFISPKQGPLKGIALKHALQQELRALNIPPIHGTDEDDIFNALQLIGGICCKK